ncbi:MAG: hypothetical protein WCL29_03470 [Pseudomonadota bacterium]
MKTETVKPIINLIHDDGLNIDISETGGLSVSPASRLTDDLRLLIREHKLCIVEWLQTSANDSQKDGQRQPYPGTNEKFKAASAALDAQILASGQSLDLPPEPPPLSEKPVCATPTQETPRQTKPVKVKHVDKSWKPLALEYYEHHFKCPFCISAGKGAIYGLKCGTGATLWALYQKASEECESRKE